MSLENQINFIIKTMANSGYKVNRIWAINYINIKEKKPNISKNDLIKEAFEDSLIFYEELIEDCALDVGI